MANPTAKLGENGTPPQDALLNSELMSWGRVASGCDNRLWHECQSELTDCRRAHKSMPGFCHCARVTTRCRVLFDTGAVIKPRIYHCYVANNREAGTGICQRCSYSADNVGASGWFEYESVRKPG